MENVFKNVRLKGDSHTNNMSEWMILFQYQMAKKRRDGDIYFEILCKCESKTLHCLCL